MRPNLGALILGTAALALQPGEASAESLQPLPVVGLQTEAVAGQVRGAITNEQRNEGWKLPVRVGLAAGVDREETSEYSLGDALAFHAYAQVQPLAIPLELGLSVDSILTEQGSGLEGLDVMVGGQPFKNRSVRGYLTVGDSFEAREPYGETTLNGAPSYGVLVSGDIHKVVFGSQALAVSCHASAQQHLYGGGSPTAWNVAGGCGLSLDLVVSGGGRKKERPEVAKTTPDMVRIDIKGGVPKVEFKVPEWDDFSTIGEAQKKAFEKHREMLGWTLGGYHNFGWSIEGGQYDKAYGHFIDMEKINVPLEPDDYSDGASAARGLGDVKEVIRIVSVWVDKFPDNQEAKDWAQDLQRTYSPVELIVSSKLTTDLSVIPTELPMAPDQRTSIDAFNLHLNQHGTYTLWLPNGVYTIAGEEFTVQPGQTVVLKVKPSRE